MNTLPFAPYAALHAAMRKGDLPPRYLLFHVQDGVGGYADRLKGLANALLLAMLLDRALLVHWPVPGALPAALPPAGIDWRPEGAAGLDRLLPWNATLAWDRVMQDGPVPFVNAIDSERLDGLLPALRTEDIEARWFHGQPLVALASNVFFYEALLANPRLAEKARVLGLRTERFLSRHFGEFFRLCFGDPLAAAATPVAVHAAPFVAAFRDAAAQGRRVLGIQIRTGGDGAWDDPCFLRMEEAEAFFRQALTLEAPGKPPAQWFLETDSERLKDEARRRFGRRILTTDWPVSHIDRSADRGLRDMERVIAKHLLLAACDALLVGAGGFGRTAAWLGGIDWRGFPDFAPQRG